MILFLQKPRFEDNGDIEPCDTESRMINRPDDFGVRESSSSVSRVKIHRFLFLVKTGKSKQTQ